MRQTDGGGDRQKIVLRIKIRTPNFSEAGRAFLFAPRRIAIKILKAKLRWRILALAVVLVIAQIYGTLTPYFQEKSYALGEGASLLSETSDVVASRIKYSQTEQAYHFNTDQQQQSDQIGAPTMASATAYKDPKKGVSVTDPTNKISFTMKPKFNLQEGRQEKDRIVYPLSNGTGWAVYTMRGIGVKEDIVLTHSPASTASYAYTLELGDGLSAKLQPDGSLGIYGDTLLSGNVTTSNDKDAELLKKARKNADKSSLLFTIPAPVVNDKHGPANGITAKFALRDNELSVNVTGLEKGNYPITIDPSIYVVSAQQFMAGNNETNINFDTDNKLIKKGRTTGARFDAWSTSASSLPTAVLGASTVTSGGYIYTIGGKSDATIENSISWAKIDDTSGTITSPDPGDGACSTWCTNAAYSLPDGRYNFALVAYNGYLYVIGGFGVGCTVGNGTGTSGYCKTVYVAKLGANGEPKKWHPTSTDTNNWDYWYRDTDLPSERSYTAAAAYNNRIYLTGGLTSSGIADTVHIAGVNPNGTLDTWTASPHTLPTANRAALVTVAYNDRLYIIGGISSSYGIVNSVYYTKINSDGSINDWVQTSSFTNARINYGGNFSVVWGGYLYISGGCAAINGNAYCTSVLSDTQVASINADGSLGLWSTLPGVSDTRFGHSLVAWRDYLYISGGCISQNPTTGYCSTDLLSSIKYAEVNQDGDISIPTTSVASGTAPCSGGTPTNCNMTNPAIFSTGAIHNGYLYVIGGCTNNGCSGTWNTVTFTGISSDGELVRPASCPSGSSSSSGWCLNGTTLPTSRAGASVSIFNDTMYVIGGFTGGGLSNRLDRATINSSGTLGSWSSQNLTSVSALSIAYGYTTVRANPAAVATNPGNLYIIGGCTTLTGPTCTAYTTAIYKCDIATSRAISNCTTTNQAQLSTGIGMMNGATWGDYIYLMGGATASNSEIATTTYAKFNNNNDVDTTAGWTTSSVTLPAALKAAGGMSYNGYLYMFGGYTTGVGPQDDIYFVKLDIATGDLDSSGWNTSAVKMTARWGAMTYASNASVFIAGGCSAGNATASCSTRTSVIEKVKIFNNGSGGPQQYVQNTPNTGADTIGASSTIMNGYIYQVGGCTNIGCSSLQATTYYAPINSDGSLGSWSSGGSLPASRSWGKLVNAGGTLYYIGGQTGAATTTAVSTIYYTSGISSGNPTWNGTAATRGIGDSGSGAQARTQAGITTWNNRIYVVGGFNSSGTATATVYSSPQQTSGGDITGNWTTDSTSPANSTISVARAGASVVAYANNLYVIGGYDGTNYLSDTQYAKIDNSSGSSAGTVGSWSFSTSLPAPTANADAFATNGYLYLIGGRSATSTCNQSTVVAPISANTSTNGSPTGLGYWDESNQRFGGPRYGNSAVHNDGKLFILGGGCSALIGSGTGVTNDRIYTTALMTQPQVAKYSIMFDTDSDVYPSHWLLNGIDNSIGARWQLKYRSMTNPGAATQCAASGAMSTWGQDTDFGNVTLGLPGLYTPKDGTGVNTSCARYFYMNTIVDSSQAFGYPDDVTRGPTITDMTLRYTADPTKRLLHGRTFTGGLQMPNDTPYYAN